MEIKKESKAKLALRGRLGEAPGRQWRCISRGRRGESAACAEARRGGGECMRWWADTEQLGATPVQLTLASGLGGQ